MSTQTPHRTSYIVSNTLYVGSIDTIMTRAESTTYMCVGSMAKQIQRMCRARYVL